MPMVRETLHDYFKAKSDKQVADGDNLFSAGLLDSIGVLELVYHLEQSLNIEVEPDDISESNFKSLNAIAALVEGKLR